MDYSDAKQRPAAACVLDVPRDLGLRHAGIMLERESRDRLSILVAAADARKGDDGADIGAPARQRRHLCGRVECLSLQADGHLAGPFCFSSAYAGESYPPVIGGKNAISRAPASAVSAFTCVRSSAARITFGLAKACAYSSPRRESH